MARGSTGEASRSPSSPDLGFDALKARKPAAHRLEAEA